MSRWISFSSLTRTGLYSYYSCLIQASIKLVLEDRRSVRPAAGCDSCGLVEIGPRRKGSTGRFLICHQGTKGLIRAPSELYFRRHALDYCGNFADSVASRILLSCWRSPDSHYFGDCRDYRRDQARHRSRCVRPSDCVLADTGNKF